MLDPVLLGTFLVVAETRSFTGAAHHLGLRQSTVSQQIRKLEAVVGRQLFLRDTHSVELTGDGEAMIGFAHGILEANERAMAYFTGPEPRGRLRFGAAEDFVLSQLPDILRQFRLSHPLVDLELTVELSGVLHEKLRAGEIDLGLVKRSPGEGPPGRLLWREQLAWVGGAGTRLDVEAPVPLIAYPPPSITRVHAIDALQRHGRAWRVACTSGSLSGLRAAVLAGLGVTLFAHSVIPAGLREMPPETGLPDPGEIEFVLISRAVHMSVPAAALADAIVAEADRLHRTTVS